MPTYQIVTGITTQKQLVSIPSRFVTGDPFCQDDETGCCDNPISWSGPLFLTSGGGSEGACCDVGLPENINASMYVFGSLSRTCDVFEGTYLLAWISNYVPAVARICGAGGVGSGAWVYSGTVDGHTLVIELTFDCGCVDTSNYPVWEIYAICDGTNGFGTSFSTPDACDSVGLGPFGLASCCSENVIVTLSEA